MGNNRSLGAVYAGRFVAGLGVGQTVVVGPIYLAEISPAPIRGLCTCVFTGFVYLGIVLAYFTNYGCELHLGNTHNRWVSEASPTVVLQTDLCTGSAYQFAYYVFWYYLHPVLLPARVPAISDQKGEG